MNILKRTLDSESVGTVAILLFCLVVALVLGGIGRFFSTMGDEPTVKDTCEMVVTNDYAPKIFPPSFFKDTCR